MKKIIKTLSIILAFILLFTFSVCVNPILDVFSQTTGVITVVIDAGHGGIDVGVTGASGVKESELNLDISMRLKSYFEANGIKVCLTRNGDNGLYGLATKGFKKRDLAKRKEIIEKSNAVIVISIHINKCPWEYRRGVQFFYKMGNEKSKELALELQKKFNEMPTSPDSDNQAFGGDYYILNCTNKISILAECGFLSNLEDEKLLITKEYREQVAYNIYEGVFSFLLTNLNVKI